MNILDIVFAIPMAYLIWKGYHRGLIFEITSLLGLLLGCWAATHLSAYVSDLLDMKGESAALVAFFITFVAAVLLSVLLGRCVKGLFKMAKMGALDRLTGAALGFLKALCLLGILVSFVVMIDPHEKVLKPAAKESSLFYKPVSKTGSWLVSSLETYVAQRRYEKSMEQQEQADSAAAKEKKR